MDSKHIHVDVVLYHDPCWDGITSATIVKRKYPDAVCVGLPPTGAAPLTVCENKHVLIVDMALSTASYEALEKVASSITTLDHHVGNEEKLASVPVECKCFDLHKCGAELAWDFCFPELPYPTFLKYVSAYDLWHLDAVPSIEDHKSLVMTEPLTIENMNRFLSMNEDDYNAELARVQSATKLRHAFIESLLRSAVVRLTWIDSQVYLVVYVENGISMLNSDVGYMAMQQYPMCDFAVVYRHNQGYDTTSFSLRSNDQHVDVNLVAKHLGGGGHRNAAGVVLPGYVTTLGSCTDSGELIQVLETVTMDAKDERLLVVHSSAHQALLANFLFRRVSSARAILFVSVFDSHLSLLLKCHRQVNAEEWKQWCQRLNLDAQTGSSIVQKLNVSTRQLKLTV